MATASVNQWASVEDFEKIALAPHPHPHNPSHILEASDGSDNTANIPDMPALAPTEASGTKS